MVKRAGKLYPPAIQSSAPEHLTTRLKLAGSTHEDLLGMTDKIEEASALLADAGVDLIVFNCTAVSTFDPAIGATIAKRITDACGRAATTTSDALLAAFRVLNAKRVVLITPYVKAVNLREIEFLRHYGIEVLSETGLDLREGTGMAAVPPDRWVELARENRNDSADAYFLSCTAIHVTPIIDDLERELSIGCPSGPDRGS